MNPSSHLSLILTNYFILLVPLKACNIPTTKSFLNHVKNPLIFLFRSLFQSQSCLIFLDFFSRASLSRSLLSKSVHMLSLHALPCSLSPHSFSPLCCRSLPLLPIRCPPLQTSHWFCTELAVHLCCISLFLSFHSGLIWLTLIALDHIVCA